MVIKPIIPCVFILGGCCLLLSIAVIAGCGEKIGPGTASDDSKPVVQTRIDKAEISREPILYEAVATIRAYTTSTISGKIMGAVMAVQVREGDQIKQDSILATLDARQVEAQLDQAQAALTQAQRAEKSAISGWDAARAGALLAETTYERSRKLVSEHTISQQAFDEAKSRHLQAQAAVSQSQALLDGARSRIKQAEAAVREATVAKKDATVRAPYDGRVTARMIDEGDLVSPGTPLFTVEQDGAFCAELVLPERHLTAIGSGLEVGVDVPALGPQRFSGKVCEIVPQADVGSRSFQIKIAMPRGPDYKSGMFARAFIPLGIAETVTVPRTAIVDQGQLNVVYVVGDDRIARLRLVKTGRTYGERVEIISGLDAGQRYLAVVPPAFQAGTPVEEAP